MANYHSKPSNRTKKPLAPLDSRGKRVQEIGKKQAQRPIRRSARLRNTRGFDKRPEESYSLFSQHQAVATLVNDRKRKRQPEPEDHLRSVVAKETSQAAPARPEDEISAVRAASPAIEEVNPIDYWRKEGSWPKKYFEQDEDTRAYLTRDLDEESWVENFLIPNREHMESTDGPEGKEGLERMRALLARKKSSSNLRRVQSQSGSLAQNTTTPSDQKPRETKSAEYKHPRYRTELAEKSSFMDKDEVGITKESQKLYRTLLETDQEVPEDSIFRDDLFEDICREIQDRNEAKVIQDIARLIIPSARHLAIRGAKPLKILTESVNEGWNNSIPVTKTRPQPDYAVGFGRSAFTKEQLDKLQPLIGELTDTSYFMATWYMYFPFLTCEVKCGAAALDVADRQNAHSMTLAVRAIVELFRLVKREKEIDHGILAFSVSHDHRSVRIYGHYPVINGKDTKYYRHPIRTFDFTELDGKEKWTAYKFTKNVYDNWVPSHFKRICSVIDDIPLGVNFGLSQSASFSEEPQIQASQQSISSGTMLEEDNSQPSLVGSQDITPNTSFSDQQFKKPRKRRAAE
ncbi:MAG: hypothetical protein M1816_002020 [Peltula sp. TS41687]|nr:MAG: hypothetical protein M1816_002020 [Peltula sp. TS41687]